MEHATRSIGANIKRLRKARGLTADALARSVGITENALRKLEAGDSKEPRFSTGLHLAEALDAPAISLLTGASVQRSTSGPDLAVVIREIRKCRDALTAEGIESVSIFGSVARGDANAGSDIDVMVRPSKSAIFTLLNLVGVEQMLSQALGTKVDVTTERSIQASRIRASVEEDAVLVF